MRLFSLLFLLLAATVLPLSSQELQHWSMELEEGEEQTLVGTNIRIRYVKLVSDSRCPRNVICVHAGRAIVEMELTWPGEEPQRFTLKGSGDIQDVGRYTVELYRAFPFPALPLDPERGPNRVRVLVREPDRDC